MRFSLAPFTAWFLRPNFLHMDGWMRQYEPVLFGDVENPVTITWPCQIAVRCACVYREDIDWWKWNWLVPATAVWVARWRHSSLPTCRPSARSTGWSAVVINRQLRMWTLLSQPSSIENTSIVQCTANIEHVHYEFSSLFEKHHM